MLCKFCRGFNILGGYMTDNTFLIKQLQHPQGPVDVVLDTDTYNEIDDQFALAYLLLSGDKLRTQAVYAAPFLNNKSTSPKDGMEKSYNEIINVLKLCGRDDLIPSARKGSDGYLPDEMTPVQSDAASDLVWRALAHSPDDPLYVLAIGAITNVASALLIEPAIKNNIVIVFLGGHAVFWPPKPEFNMMQDVAAGRVVFGCGAPLVQLPCMGVVSHLTVTEPELRHHLKEKSPIGDYLYNITCGEVQSYGGGNAWSRVIWDVSTVAWLLSDRFVSDALVPSPIPSYDHGYIHDPHRHLARVAYYVNRDLIFADMFAKLSK